MLNGLSGSLLSHYFAECRLAGEFSGALGEETVAPAFHRFGRWWQQASQLGPASSLRAITDQAAVPLAEALGFRASGGVLTHRNARVALLVGVWTDSLDALWRNAVRAGLAGSTPWCLCCNGRELRLVDAERTYSRAYLQFDLERLTGDLHAFSVFWGVMRADAFDARGSDTPLITRIVRQSARHSTAVGRSLRSGVLDAVAALLTGLLGPRGGNRRLRVGELDAGLDESLTLVYRMLFLMFAEARGLVPNWHPIYRDHYTIEALRDAADRPGPANGLWPALQAISRLAHRGCWAGTLWVPAFNGRLFSPARSPMAESSVLPDDVVRSALTSLSRTPASQGRIDYRDLGVEQLGAVYESVLEYRPAFTEPGTTGNRVLLRRGGDQRKTTGSFYTPQSITDYLVRRTLHPLVDSATSAGILQLRVVDPSMGSAAFLVAACRFLARAYERALLREGALHEGELTDGDRAGFRRTIAQTCLFGVDLNPTAVQLARLSLWLATLAAGKPLSFLDHHLVCGDSLLGATPLDLARQGPPRTGRQTTSRNIETPLFSETDFEGSVAAAVTERRWIADTRDDTVAVVWEKEKRLAQIHGVDRWKTMADLWCACWMWPRDTKSPGGAVFSSLCEQLQSGRAVLPTHVTEPLLETSRSITESRRFLHWPFEFPEIFFDGAGRPLENPGFDAVLGNPPWNMLRGDTPEKAFIRGSGVYRHQGGGRLNRYQLFVERALALTKQGGRMGLVVPSGFATDHTSSRLRRRVMDHCDIDSLAGFDNRHAIFPIHRSVRFILFTATAGRPTASIKCRFGIHDPAVLDTIPDQGDRAADPIYTISLTPDLIGRLTGEQRAIPELRAPRDLSIVERIVHRFPRLSSADGWNVQFGRELNATDDKAHFSSDKRRGMPVLEGKHIECFAARVERSTSTISERQAARLIDPARSFRRARLAYRDVASSTNRMSLIAAILPSGVVTTHSLFCLKTLLGTREQEYLCGMLNSFVANYLVRQVMTTHLGSTTVENLRVPKVSQTSAEFQRVSSLASALGHRHSQEDAARLQAAAAHAYQLTEEEFGHVLSSFPLVPESERTAALDAFSRWPETAGSA
jgi:hypothetical protein